MPAADWRSLYPFASHWLELEGGRMHYIDEGSGPPLLFVHGNPTWSFYWRNLIVQLRGSYRSIAVDHLGCGLSDKPQRYDYTLARHTENLARLIEKLDLTETTLLAHDWGGAIGLGAALSARQRFARIVLFNTAAFPPPFVPLRIRVCRMPLLGTAAIRGLNLFAKAAQWMAVEHPENLTPEARAGYLAPYQDWRSRVAIDRFVRDIPMTRRHATWRTLATLESRLEELAQLPIALIWGMRDWCFTPQCLRRLQESFPAAETHALAGAGHYVVEDEPAEVARIVAEFLNRTAETHSQSPRA